MVWMCICRTPGCIKHTVVSMSTLFKAAFPFDDCTFPKFHMSCHYPWIIRRYGNIRDSNTSAGTFVSLYNCALRSVLSCRHLPGEAQHKNRVKPLMPRTPRHHATFLGDMFSVMLVSLRLAWLAQVYGLDQFELRAGHVTRKVIPDINRVGRSLYHTIDSNLMSFNMAVCSLSTIHVMTSGSLPPGYTHAYFKEETLKLGLICLRKFACPEAHALVATIPKER